MLRSVFVSLLSLIICAAGQENQPTFRPRLLPVPGRAQPISLGSQSISPVVAATQSPVIIQLLSTQTPVVTAAQISTDDTPLQPVDVTLEPSAAPATQLPVAIVKPKPQVVGVSLPPESEVLQVPVEPEEEVATYEFAPETETQPGSESELELVLQPASDLVSKSEPDHIPQPDTEVAAAPQTALYSVKPESLSNPVAVKPSAALPPLLPKPISVREPHFGRPTVSTTQYPITTTTVTQLPTQRVTTVFPVITTTLATPQLEPLRLDFICREGNGYYVVNNQCDSYIECKYNKAKQRWCPDGLHFNPAAKRYEYPCAYPSVVKCAGGTDIQNPSPTGQCPRKYGFFSTNDGDCTTYIVCQGGAATLMNCPAGLVFNPTVQSCDWVENVPQCNPNVFQNYVCPEPPIDEYGLVSDVIYRYRYEGQCKLYIACHRGYRRFLSCPYGLSFDEDSQSCVEEELVKGCATPR